MVSKYLQNAELSIIVTAYLAYLIKTIRAAAHCEIEVAEGGTGADSIRRLVALAVLKIDLW